MEPITYSVRKREGLIQYILGGVLTGLLLVTLALGDTVSDDFNDYSKVISASNLSLNAGEFELGDIANALVWGNPGRPDEGYTALINGNELYIGGKGSTSGGGIGGLILRLNKATLSQEDAKFILFMDSVESMLFSKNYLYLTGGQALISVHKNDLSPRVTKTYQLQEGDMFYSFGNETDRLYISTKAFSNEGGITKFDNSSLELIDESYISFSNYLTFYKLLTDSQYAYLLGTGIVGSNGWGTIFKVRKGDLAFVSTKGFYKYEQRNTLYDGVIDGDYIYATGTTYPPSNSVVVKVNKNDLSVAAKQQINSGINLFGICQDNGYVYVVGVTTGSKGIIEKIRKSDLQVVSQQSFSSGASDEFQDCIVDGGSVYVVGKSQINDGQSGYYDLLLVRFDKSLPKATLPTSPAGFNYQYAGTTTSSFPASLSSVNAYTSSMSAQPAGNTPTILNYESVAKQTYTIPHHSGLLVSNNLLEGLQVHQILSFSYVVPTLPSGTSLSVQFSQDGLNWVNSEGQTGSWDGMLQGSHAIDVAGLGWSTPNFYYRVRFTAPGTEKPVMDAISVDYDSCAPNGNSCTANSDCCSSNCKADWDGIGGFCCDSTQCSHNGICFIDGACQGSYVCSSGEWANHCSNGIKDCDESGMDCGGSGCASCFAIELNSPKEDSESPPKAILNVTISNPAGKQMNVSFYDASDDSSIGEVRNAQNNSMVTTIWNNLEPKSQHSWYVIVNSSAGNEQSSVWSFTVKGYKVIGLPASLSIVDQASRNLSSDYAYGRQWVMLKQGQANVANFTLNFTHNINLSDIIAMTNLTAAKSLIKLNRTKHPEVVSDLTLRVPAIVNSGAVYVCPNASTLKEVNTTCPRVRLTEGLTPKQGYYSLKVNGTGGGEPSSVIYEALVNKPGAYGLQQAQIGKKIRARVNNKYIESMSAQGWHQYALRYNGSVLTLFIDAQPVASASYTAHQNLTLTNIQIGKLFPGYIDDVKLFNTSISQLELKRLYSEGINTRQVSLQGDATYKGEKWNARVWVSNTLMLSPPVDSNTIKINKTCPLSGCGEGGCPSDEYGYFDPGAGCHLTCYKADELQAACEFCNSGNWSTSLNTCCNTPNDTFCVPGAEACVAGVYYSSHCEDRIKDCDEQDIDCNGSCPVCGLTYESTTKTTRYLKAPQWEVLTWNVSARGSRNYSLNITPKYSPKMKKVNLLSRIQKIIILHTKSLSNIFFRDNEHSKE